MLSSSRLLGSEAQGETLARPVSLGYPIQGENPSWYLQLATSGKVTFQTHKPSSSPTFCALHWQDSPLYPSFSAVPGTTLDPKVCTQVWIGEWELKVRNRPRREMGLLCGGGGGLTVNPLQYLMQPRPSQENGTVKKAIAQMIQSLLLSLAARSQLQELREKLRSPVVDKGPVLKAKPPAAQKDILGVCSDPLVLAQQLTHIELVSAVYALALYGVGLGYTWHCLARGTSRIPSCWPVWAMIGKLAC